MTTNDAQRPSPALSQAEGPALPTAAESAARARRRASLSLVDAGILLHAAVEAKGEHYVYPQEDPNYRTSSGQCRYSTPDGQPACIVGHVFYSINESYLPDFDFINDVESAVTAIQSYDPAFGFDALAVELLTYAQESQDGDLEWGESERNAWKRVLVETSPLPADDVTMGRRVAAISSWNDGMSHDYRLGTIVSADETGHVVTIDLDESHRGAAERREYWLPMLRPIEGLPVPA